VTSSRGRKGSAVRRLRRYGGRTSRAAVASTSPARRQPDHPDQIMRESSGCTGDYLGRQQHLWLPRSGSAAAPGQSRLLPGVLRRHQGQWPRQWPDPRSVRVSPLRYDGRSHVCFSPRYLPCSRRSARLARVQHRHRSGLASLRTRRGLRGRCGQSAKRSVRRLGVHRRAQFMLAAALVALGMERFMGPRRPSKRVQTARRGRANECERRDALARASKHGSFVRGGRSFSVAYTTEGCASKSGA
jgi:hypothetical protein